MAPFTILRTHLLLSAFLVAVSLVFPGCSGADADAPRAAPSQPAVPVTVGKVIEKEMPLEINAVGAVEAYSTVAVRAQVTGELTNVNFRQGEDVQAGQVLFTLDHRPLEAALRQAEANLQRDSAQAANAQVIARRMDDLVERGVGTREQRDTARTTAAALDAVVGANRAAVENAKIQLRFSSNTPRFARRFPAGPAR
jgi:multidrug efflux system membrane fusion protein